MATDERDRRRALVAGPRPRRHAGLPVSAVALGADSYLSFDGDNWSSTVLDLASDGKIAAGPSLIAQGGSAGAVIVVRGSDLVAGWIDNGPFRVEVARVKPWRSLDLAPYLQTNVVTVVAASEAVKLTVAELVRGAVK